MRFFQYCSSTSGPMLSASRRICSCSVSTCSIWLCHTLNSTSIFSSSSKFLPATSTRTFTRDNDSNDDTCCKLITETHSKSESWNTNSVRYSRSSYSFQLSVPQHNLEFGSRAFRISAPKIWNLLPASIRNSPSIPTFRQHLKTHFFSQPMLTPNDHPLPTRPDSL